MEPTQWGILIGAIVVALIVGAAIGWMITQRRSGRQLRERFGPEYDHAVESTGSKRHAEAELQKREERVRQYDIQPLPSDQRAAYAESWRLVQADFVDAPVRAVAEADELVTEVMRRRGYPMGDFERRAEDLSVDHPRVIENYRAAHVLALRSDRGQADTEDLRQAMVHYRSLFEELLEEPQADLNVDGHRDGLREAQRGGRVPRPSTERRVG